MTRQKQRPAATDTVDQESRRKYRHELDRPRCERDQQLSFAFADAGIEENLGLVVLVNVHGGVTK